MLTKFFNFVDKITKNIDIKIQQIPISLARIKRRFVEFNAVQGELQKLDANNLDQHKE